MLSLAVLVDHAAGGMIRFGQLRQGIMQRRAAILQLGERRRRSAAPVNELRRRVARMRRHQFAPRLLFLRDDAAHPLGDQRVLRLEVAVERHLVRVRRRRDGFHADAANADAPKQIVGGG